MAEEEKEYGALLVETSDPLLESDLHMIRVGEERYKIFYAVIFGG
jgi:hypothetical protein